MPDDQPKDEVYWLSAGLALARLVPAFGEDDSKATLVKRANAGLIRTRARKLTRYDRDGRRVDTHDAEVPARFFSSTDGDDIKADWQFGDFENFVHEEWAAVRWSVVGLQFELDGIDRLISENTLPRLTAPLLSGAGRPVVYDWEGALIGLIGRADKDGLEVDKTRGAIAKISRMLGQQFVAMGSLEPSKSELDRRASRILKALYPDPL